MAEKPKRGRRKLTEEEKAANRIKRTSAKRKERQEARKKEKELKKKLQQELQIIKREPVRAIVLQKKRLYLEEFFNTINVGNDPLLQIKKNIIQLLAGPLLYFVLKEDWIVMTQITYFVTPKTLVKITTKAGEFLPIKL